MKIILGSQSKGRAEMLKEMGYEFEVMPANIDERAIRAADAEKLTLKLARAKADALLPRIFIPALLITSDQVVLWNGLIREKPENPEEAWEYLEGYAEHPAETVTAVVVTDTMTKERKEGVDIARVHFRKIPEKVIEKLVAEGDVFTHAGGFSNTNPLLKPYTDRIEGAPDSVIGLPKELTRRLIGALYQHEKP